MEERKEEKNSVGGKSSKYKEQSWKEIVQPQKASEDKLIARRSNRSRLRINRIQSYSITFNHIQSHSQPTSFSFLSYLLTQRTSRSENENVSLSFKRPTGN